MSEKKHPTKLHKILSDRALNQKDLHELIVNANNGNQILPYILNGIVNGKRSYKISTLKMIKNAFPDLSYEDIID